MESILLDTFVAFGAEEQLFYPCRCQAPVHRSCRRLNMKALELACLRPRCVALFGDEPGQHDAMRGLQPASELYNQYNECNGYNQFNQFNHFNQYGASQCNPNKKILVQIVDIMLLLLHLIFFPLESARGQYHYRYEAEGKPRPYQIHLLLYFLVIFELLGPRKASQDRAREWFSSLKQSQDA